MFGYLNLNDPTKIRDNEAQESVNVRPDRGYLEYQQFTIDETIGRLGSDINNFPIYIADSEDVPVEDIALINKQGALCRLVDGIPDIVGTPAIATLNDFAPPSDPNPKPKLSLASTGTDQIYPPGRAYYAITIYNPATNEESEAYKCNLAVGVNQTTQFEDFPSLASGAGVSALDVFAAKTGAEFRIYRRPVGGEQYLRTFTGTTIPAFNTSAGPYIDMTSDDDLGDPCLTINPRAFAPFYFPKDTIFSLFTVHNNRLWFKQDAKRDASPGLDSAGSVIYYSNPYVFGEIPIDNYFAFNSPIVGLHSIDEALVVICKNDIFVIYGDSPKDFTVRQVTSGSKVGGAGYYSSVAIGNTLAFLCSDKETRTKADGLFLMAGGLIRRASFPIDTMFPLEKFSTGTPENVFGAGSVEDRFFVLRTASGSVIYDIVTGGFLFADSSKTEFYYRSKEFGSPGWWNNMRRAFVRGIGDFKVELYLDGIKVDEIEFSIPGSTPQTEDFTVPGLRANYFSFRFVGQQNAKIFEFGRKE